MNGARSHAVNLRFVLSTSQWTGWLYESGKYNRK
jgi:hypothetical protein